MYLLMNKNQEIGKFSIEPGAISENYKIHELITEKAPFGFYSLENWINQRKASKHNEHLKRIMTMCGCEKTEGFLRITHAASLNDTFWIKSEEESLTWEKVSLYQNQFNEVISRLAFEGIGLYGIELSSSSPELSTEGSFRKCWKKEGSEIFLYKRGQSGGRNTGLEPYGEVMASELAVLLCKNAVSYDLVRLHGEIASKCRLFTDENIGFIPYSRLGIAHSPNEMLKYYSHIGSEDTFRRMLVLDSLTFNVDRHAGNHGVFIQNDTLKVIRMADIFDLNLALLPYVEKDEFEAIGSKLTEYSPRIGDDFTRIGQIVLTSSIRADLISLKGFRFSFRGDESFPAWRVKILEEMVNKQIEALLRKDILYTKDVFISEVSKKLPEKPTAETNLLEQEQQANFLIEKLHNCSLHCPTALNIEDNHVDLILFPAEHMEIYIHMGTNEIRVEQDGIELSGSEIQALNPVAVEYYEKVIGIIYNNSSHIKEESENP